MLLVLGEAENALRALPVEPGSWQMPCRKCRTIAFLPQNLQSLRLQCRILNEGPPGLPVQLVSFPAAPCPFRTCRRLRASNPSAVLMSRIRKAPSLFAPEASVLDCKNTSLPTAPGTNPPGRDETTGKSACVTPVVPYPATRCWDVISSCYVELVARVS